MRLVLNKADSIEFKELMQIYGALFWNLSPLINSTEPPRVYVGSFHSEPLRGAPVNNEFFLSEERSLINDIRVVVTNAVQVKVAEVRQHAISVLIHAEIISAYTEAFRKPWLDHWNDIIKYPQR